MVTSPQLHDPCGGLLCLDFVNGIGRTPERPVQEWIHAYTDLLLWTRQAACLPAGTLDRLGPLAEDEPDAAAALVPRARAFREAAFWTLAPRAIDPRDLPAPPPEPTATLALVNAEIAAALSHTRLEPTSEGFAWGWCTAGGPELLAAPLWAVARSLGELLASDDLARVKQCASERCIWLFLDRSKNRARRWCEMKSCGNRAKVREFRRRKRTRTKADEDA